MKAPLTSPRPTTDRSAPSEIEQYSKWFDLNEMDFALVCRSQVWRCVAWERSDIIGDESYSDFPLVAPSSYSYYTGYSRDLTTSMARCYEAVRSTQRTSEALHYPRPPVGPPES